MHGVKPILTTLRTYNKKTVQNIFKAYTLKFFGPNVGEKCRFQLTDNENFIIILPERYSVIESDTADFSLVSACVAVCYCAM